MENFTLVAHIPSQLLALIESKVAYEKSSGLRVADGVREFLLAASPDFLSALQDTTAPDPWRFGFAIVHRIGNVVIGLCGFAGPQDSDGLVEIAYSISPDYQGRGFATEAATALVDFASSSGRVRTVCAYTLPEMTASTRVLEKCGFRKTGEIFDSENHLVWRWEKNPAKIGTKQMTEPLLVMSSGVETSLNICERSEIRRQNSKGFLHFGRNDKSYILKRSPR